MIDAQMKRGLLEVCVLSVLSRGDSYGYKLIKELSQCISVSESTLYPVLRRLETAGHVSVYTLEHNGRLRKMYAITVGGQQEIDDFLVSWKEIAAIYTFIREGRDNDKK